MASSHESRLHLEKTSPHGGMFFDDEPVHHDGGDRVVGLGGPFNPPGHRHPHCHAHVIEGPSNELASGGRASNSTAVSRMDAR